jgi:hypothetical protein
MAKSRTAASKTPTLPTDLYDASYEAATALDDLYANGRFSQKVFEQKVLDYKKDLFAQIAGSTALDQGPFALAWPPHLFIPGDADWKPHWVVPPPDEHRYTHDWAPQVSAGYTEASRATGTLFASKRILSNESYVTAEAGLGALYKPIWNLCEVTLEPDVNCAGDLRWYHEFEQPVAGYTWVKTSVITAAWHQIPGGWDLVGSKRHEVRSFGPNYGLGHSGIIPYAVQLSGKALATPFVLQAARRYLLGVVARVSIWSTLTDTRGAKLPLIEGGVFRVYGTIACSVPRIEANVTQVHIK